MLFITGAKGFLGKNLSPRIGEHADIPHEKIQQTDFSKAIKVFFLSAYGNMSDHTDVSQIVRANVSDLTHVLSTINWNILESCGFISTSSVKLKTQTTYSRTKKAAEEILLAYMEKYGAPITIIRPFSITGVGEQPDHLIPRLIRSCMDGERMNFVPGPAHDFIDVNDVVDGILSLSNNRARGIFELGTGNSYTNQQVLDIVERETARKAVLNNVTVLRDYDTDSWVSTNFKSRGWGWFPRISLEESVKSMVKAYVTK